MNDLRGTGVSTENSNTKNDLLYSRFLKKNRFCTTKREPFYNAVKDYLPQDREAIIVDVGAGDGSFAKHLCLADTYKNLYVIDGNKKSVESLSMSFKNVVCARIPSRLPFENATVSLIHCSHLIEHLTPDQLYSFLEEIDRILKPGGVVVLSCPMLEARHSFYNDLSHVKPYNYIVLKNYLCGGSQTHTMQTISHKYSMRDLVFRYCRYPVGHRWGSSVFFMDFALKGLSKILALLQIYNYERDGYTIVFEKG